ncbi:MAG: protoporphyrinogen oxidase [Tannerella sp.]|jgi:oxygen-dependent protoporphyrinogen oxidase|nr:protoporphyrinogen oxidase [Tannerella sp.]
MTDRYDAVVIGAGLTGLATAFVLKQKGLSVLVVEKSGRTGGAIRTFERDGYVYESGPSTASLSNIETVALFDMLRGKCELEIARKDARKRYILKDGTLHRLPAGLTDGILTPLFSWTDKFRILAEPFRKAGSNPDESVAALTVRRLGKSFLDYAVQPFIGGVYAGDPEKLVTRFALPKLYGLEQEHGSFIRGAVARMMAGGSAEKRVTKDVFSVRGGFGKLIEALTAGVGRENILPGQQRCKVRRGAASGCVVELSDAGSVGADRVICTTGGHAAGDIFDSLMPASLRDSLDGLRYAAIIQAAVGVKSPPSADMEAFGALIPAVEKRRLLGILYPSSCFEGRAPLGKTLLSVFLGGINHPEIYGQSDTAIRRLILDELGAIHRLTEADIDFMEIFRHRHAIPQYEITCRKLLTDIAQFERANPGIILAGNIRDGVGIPHRIKQAFDTGAKLPAGRR